MVILVDIRFFSFRSFCFFVICFWVLLVSRAARTRSELGLLRNRKSRKAEKVCGCLVKARYSFRGCHSFWYKNLILLMDAQSSEVDVLGDALNKSLNIQDAQEMESVSDGHEEEGLCEQDKTSQTTSSKKCLNKCVTFPHPNTMLPASSSSDEEDVESEAVSQGLLSEESKDQAYSRSISLPTPSKLVSAMKGSREKQGVLREKLTVKWAPDVYDPTPTSVSHSVKSKSSQKSKNKKNERKNGKKGQKGNSSQRGSGKDKKQYRKAAKSSDGFGNFEVGSSNSYCGSSFRRKSCTEVHYSTAEAL